MKISKLIYGCSLALIAFFTACVGVEPIVLNDSNETPVYKPSDSDINKMSRGIVFDFRSGVSDWWSDSKIKISKRGNTMKVQANEVGPGYEPFGVNFSGSDYSNVPVVRIRIKIDEETTEYPTLRMDLKDGSDIQTNASPVAAQLAKPEVDTTNGYVYYYYDFNHKWAQSFPTSAKVDNKDISGMQFFFNPGGKPWSGTIYIDEIYVLPNKDESRDDVDTDIIIDDFAGAVDLWWPCKAEKVTVGKASPTTMKVSIKDGQWDCFGKIFGEVDITENPIIRIRARAESESGISSTNVMARFIDVNENSTDLIDGLNMSDMEVGGADFVEYYSVFKDKKENNLYSSQGEFDPKRVNRVIIFINMNKEANFTGDVIVDEIAFVQKLPKEIEVLRGNVWGPQAAVDPTWPVADEYSTIDDCSTSEGWKKSSEGVKIQLTDKVLVLDAAAEGSAYEYIEKDITPLNMTNAQYIKVVAKADGNEDAVLRFEFTDNFGKVTNARPQEIKVINRVGGFNEYYIKMTNNFYQRYPEFALVNSANLVKMKVYINPGLKTKYVGKIEIDDISAVTIDDLPEDWFEKLKEL